jgi:hypothetical protein
MTNVASFSYKIAPASEPDDRHPVVGAQRGRLVRVDGDGRAYVDFPGNPSGPIVAKLAVSDIEIAQLGTGAKGSEILLVFENNDITQPIIIGRVRDCLPTNGTDINIRGHRFIVDSDEEIELRCGEAKLRISRDGKVIVLGNDVLSRARRRNRIKGGSVNIN